MTETPQDNSVEEVRSSIDILLQKYLRVWIWSIIFGLNSTLTLTLSTQTIVGKYNSFVSLILSIPLIMAAFTIILSWYFLLLFMKTNLMPLLGFHYYSGKFSGEERSYRYLYAAFQFSIFAVMLRAFGIIFEAI